MRGVIAAVIGLVLLAGGDWAMAQDNPATPKAAAGPKAILNKWSFWHQFYVLGAPVVRKDGKLEAVKVFAGANEVAQWIGRQTDLPPTGWQAAGFDDGDWVRKPLADPDAPWVIYTCARSRFEVTAPEKVKELKLSVRYRGGIVVYLNGKEIARGSVKAGSAALDPADDLAADKPMEVRELAGIAIASAQLVKGVNVLAIETHQSPQLEASITKVNNSTAIANGTCGVVEAKLTAGPEDAVTPNVRRPGKFMVWNSDLMNGDLDADYGDPNEALRAIEMVAPRGGVTSGKVAAGSGGPIKGLTATMSDLAGKNGNIPATAAQVRYSRLGMLSAFDEFAMGIGATSRLDGLEETAPSEVAVVEPRLLSTPWEIVHSMQGAITSVWVTVNVPGEAKAGDYVGKLTITATGEKAVEVPVNLKVCSWKATAPKDYDTFVDITESPESVALRYDAPLWSDAHMKLLAKSLTLLGQAGNDTCYLPLICETNMGNDESMVRWIKQEDGTYKYDFTPMEKYLDTVIKYQGKPRVACFIVWDTYLEGGLSGGEIDRKDVIEERKAHAGKGPIVSMLDPATGKVEKGVLPEQKDPASEALWAPVMKGIRERMKQRGLEEEMMLGCITDQVPGPGVEALYTKVSPGTKWVRFAHARFDEMLRGMKIGYMSTPYFEGRRMFAQDPSVSRGHGWASKDMLTHFPRNTYDGFPMTTWWFMAEMNAAGEQRGFSRLGGDFFPALKNAKGQIIGGLSGRFPKTDWRMLTIQTAVLGAGKDGPVSTARFEMIRGGLQETAARIAIDKALVDEAKRAKLGPELAKKAQDLLDQRVRDMRHGLSTLRAVRTGSYLWMSAPYQDTWFVYTPVLGNCWYVESQWKKKAADLYEMASEVEAKLASGTTAAK